jgi:hypothetical protein
MTSKQNNSKARRTPALSPEAQENQMIALAMDCAEDQMRSGTASSAVIVHFLKLGTEKSKLEREKLAHETELLRAKTNAIESAQHSDELISQVLVALKRYGGSDDE